MIKKFTVKILILLVLVMSLNIQSSVDALAQNQNNQVAEQYQNLKTALLANDQNRSQTILNENPNIFSYRDSKTGRGIGHDIFLHSYPLDSVCFVLSKLPADQVNAKDLHKNRPLHYLFQNSKNYPDHELLEMLRILMPNASVLSKNNEDVAPLHLSARMMNFEFLNLMIKHLPQDYKDKGYLNWKDRQGKTPLMYACDLGNAENVINLLENGALFDANLIQSVKNMHENILKQHLEEHFEYSEEEKKRTIEGCEQSYLQKIAKLALFAKNSEFDCKDFFCNLMQQGLNINARDQLGNTLLHDAMNAYMPVRQSEKWVMIPRKYNDEYVENLLSLGADAGLSNSFGIIPKDNDDYSALCDYYEPLRNSLSKNQDRKTLFGQSVIHAYDLWESGENQDLLRQMLRSDLDESQISELAHIKARTFFKDDFIKKICEK